MMASGRPDPLAAIEADQPQSRRDKQSHAVAHANASLTDDSALDHLMSSLHLDHSNPHLPSLYPTASPEAVRAHLASMGYDHVPHETLAAIVDDLNAQPLDASTATISTAPPSSSSSSLSASTSSKRLRKRAHVVVDASYLSTIGDASNDQNVVDLTILQGNTTFSTAATAAAAASSTDSLPCPNATTTTLTRPELETYLLDMGYAPSDLDTVLVDDLLEALNESVMMGQETMMSMMRGHHDGDRRVDGGEVGFSQVMGADETANQTIGGGGESHAQAGQVHWELHDNAKTDRAEWSTTDEDRTQDSTAHRAWSPSPSSMSSRSSRGSKPTSSYRTFRPPLVPPRKPAANDPVLRYHQYARAWSTSPFLVRREREAGNAGASVWSLPSSTAAAAAAASSFMSHPRTSAGARPLPKWDDSYDDSVASTGGAGRADRDVWAVRDWIKAPGAASDAMPGAGVGRRTPGSTR